MKKILACVLCVLLAFSTAIMVGCNKGDVYDGNYSQVPATQAESFAQQVEDANQNGEFFDFSKGFSIKLDMENKSSEGDTNVEMEMITATVNDENQLYASIEMENEINDVSSKINMKAWYKNGYSFIKAKMPNPFGEGSIDLKGKEVTNYDQELSDMLTNISGVLGDIDLSILDILDEYEGEDGFKIYLDDGAELKKCKIVFPKVNEENESMEMSMVLVYDADYKLYALKYEAEAEISYSMGDKQFTQEVNIDFEIKPTTKSISYPKDINNLDAWDDDLSALEGIM